MVFVTHLIQIVTVDGKNCGGGTAAPAAALGGPTARPMGAREPKRRGRRSYLANEGVCQVSKNMAKVKRGNLQWFGINHLAKKNLAAGGGVVSRPRAGATDFTRGT